MRQALLRHQDGGVRILQHKGEPFLRIRRIEWEIRPASLQNAEQPDHRGKAALHADARDAARAETQRLQACGKGVRLIIELPVREPFLSEGDGSGVRSPLDRSLKKTVDGFSIG